jgi:hypothetical protein
MVSCVFFDFLNDVSPAHTIFPGFRCGGTDISKHTSITVEEIYYILKDRKMIHAPSDPPEAPAMPVARIKNKSGARRRTGRGSKRHADDDNFEVPPEYRIEFDRELADEYVRRWEEKRYLDLKPEKLRWTPFLVTRAFNLGVDAGSTARDPAEEHPPEKEHVRVVAPKGEEPVVVDHQGAEVVASSAATPAEAEPEQQPSTAPSTAAPVEMEPEPQSTAATSATAPVEAEPEQQPITATPNAESPAIQQQANGSVRMNGGTPSSRPPKSPSPEKRQPSTTPRRSTRAAVNGTASSPATPRRLTRGSLAPQASTEKDRINVPSSSMRLKALRSSRQAPDSISQSELSSAPESQPTSPPPDDEGRPNGISEAVDVDADGSDDPDYDG